MGVSCSNERANCALKTRPDEPSVCTMRRARRVGSSSNERQEQKTPGSRSIPKWRRCQRKAIDSRHRFRRLSKTTFVLRPALLLSLSLSFSQRLRHSGHHVHVFHRELLSLLHGPLLVRARERAGRSEERRELDWKSDYEEEIFRDTPFFFDETSNEEEKKTRPSSHSPLSLSNSFLFAFDIISLSLSFLSS